MWEVVFSDAAGVEVVVEPAVAAVFKEGEEVFYFGGGEVEVLEVEDGRA